MLMKKPIGVTTESQRPIRPGPVFQAFTTNDNTVEIITTPNATSAGFGKTVAIKSPPISPSAPGSSAVISMELGEGRVSLKL